MDSRRRSRPLSGKDIAGVIQELRGKLACSETALRTEKQQRQVVQGRLDGAQQELEQARAEIKRLENLVVQLSTRGRKQEHELEELAKQREDTRFERRTLEHRAKELSRRTEDVQQRNTRTAAQVDALKRELRERCAAQDALALKLAACETTGRAALELRAAAELRAARSDSAREALAGKLTALGRRREQDLRELEKARAALDTARFEAKALATQRDAEATKAASLAKELAEVRGELDAVSAVVLIT